MENHNNNLRKKQQDSLGLFSINEREKEPLEGIPVPRDLDTEQIVLGALLIESEALYQVIPFLQPEHFFYPKHQAIYRAILDLFSVSDPIDLLSVVDHLRREKKLVESDRAGAENHKIPELTVGYITELTTRVNSAASLEYHARIIHEYYFKRAMISHAINQIKRINQGEDVFTVMDYNSQFAYMLEQQLHSQAITGLSDAVKEVIDSMNNARQKANGITGLETGILAFDRPMSGLQPDYIIIAARPGMGKTDLMIGLSKNIAIDYKEPISIFSLEMTKVALVKRLMSNVLELSKDKIKRGDLSEEEIRYMHTHLQKIINAKIYIDDTPLINIIELRAKARQLKREKNIKAIFIDYLQLISTSQSDNKSNMLGTRDQQLGYISQQLLLIKKELGIPVIAFSQLGRQVERRPDKRPMTSDLRESGNLEQDADIIMSLYRPSYYKDDLDALTQLEGFEINEYFTELNYLKFREGALGPRPLHYEPEMGIYKDYSVYANFEDLNKKHHDENNMLPDKRYDPWGGAKGSIADDLNDAEKSPPF